MGVIQSSINRGVSIAMLLYRTSDKYKAKEALKEKTSKIESLSGRQSEFSKTISESNLSKSNKEKFASEYVDPIREQRIKEGDVSALKEKMAMQSMDSAKNEKRKRISYKDVPSSWGITLGELTKNLSPEQKKEIRKQAEPVRKEMSKNV